MFCVNFRGNTEMLKPSIIHGSLTSDRRGLKLTDFTNRQTNTQSATTISEAPKPDPNNFITSNVSMNNRYTVLNYNTITENGLRSGKRTRRIIRCIALASIGDKKFRRGSTCKQRRRQNIVMKMIFKYNFYYYDKCTNFIRLYVHHFQ